MTCLRCPLLWLTFAGLVALALYAWRDPSLPPLWGNR